MTGGLIGIGKRGGIFGLYSRLIFSNFLYAPLSVIDSGPTCSLHFLSDTTLVICMTSPSEHIFA